MEIDKKKLDLALAAKCYSLTDLANAAGLSNTVFTKMFRGNSKPRSKTIGKIAKALGVTPIEIIKE